MGSHSGGVDGGATSIMNNSENSVNFVIKGDENTNYVTVSGNTYGDTTVSWPWNYSYNVYR